MAEAPLRGFEPVAIIQWREAPVFRTAMTLCAVLFAASGFGVVAYSQLASIPILVAPPMERPGYLQATTDPEFGTSFTRVTDPGQLLAPGSLCKPEYCRHRYSSTQAWNADQSLLAINDGCNGICFLDGRTYIPAFHRPMSDDCKWHPVDPELMICISRYAIYRWAPRNDVKAIVYAPSDYTNLQFGPYKGNLSFDGNRLVVVATNRAGALVAFGYDLSTKIKYPDINLSSLPGAHAYCGISPSGRYVYCFHRTTDETEVTYIFALDGTQIQYWPEHHRPGHGDMTIDADGSDVYVGVSKADPDKWHVIKRRLQDGKVTDLIPAGYGTHVSTRNIRRPGWAFVSYEGTRSKVAGSPGYAPFYREVIAVRIDGSGQVRRIAQTRNAKRDYYSETHASPSPDASQVVWSSNWDQPGGPVADYVSRPSWPQTASGG
ncbi:hypothetical protein XH90_26710 [Bradyrhizobium sp. CCBAU 53338]|nr:hypothetical protein XH90_26710 [Bradyrhizobium sp. CCBAU 53338]